MKSIVQHIEESLQQEDINEKLNSKIEDVLADFANSVLTYKEFSYHRKLRDIAEKVVPNILEILKTKGHAGLEEGQIEKLYKEIYLQQIPFSHQFFKKYHQSIFTEVFQYVNMLK